MAERTYLGAHTSVSEPMYPQYISINLNEKGDVEISVRAAPGAGKALVAGEERDTVLPGAYASMSLSPHLAKALFQEVLGNLK